MKKMHIGLLLLSLISVAACTNTTQNPPEIETELENPQTQEQSTVRTEENTKKTPLDAILAENILLLAQDAPSRVYTEIRAEFTNTDTTADQATLKVNILQDNLPDDSVKKEEYELQLKFVPDIGWEVSSKELIDLECYRGKIDDLCI